MNESAMQWMANYGGYIFLTLIGLGMLGFAYFAISDDDLPPRHPDDDGGPWGFD